MKRGALALALFAASCALAPPETDDFRGDYARSHTIRFFDGSTDAPQSVEDTLSIGPSRGGVAVFSLNMVFDNGHLCAIEDAAAQVTGAGLVFRVVDPEEGGPFTLAIDVADGVARLRVIEGQSTYFCGMRGRIASGVAFRKTAP